jgi:ABC-type bacteriocin/lantibiotic exporter with double-glycine peptidase domain
VADGRRSFLVPEVVQTSAMDCGPASLKCLLEGFGVRASYGRLREACQTDVDGTSIDTIEDLAVQLGLDAEQVVVPTDHVLLPQTALLPAIAVVRLPGGVTHFAVAWRRHGPLVQVMDPATGRRWVTIRRFLDDLYVHEVTVAAALWHEWAASAATLAAIGRRLAIAGVARPVARRILDRAAADTRWGALAAADAAARMTAALVVSGGVSCGAEATRLFERIFTRTIERGAGDETIVPRSFWSAWPAPSDSAGTEQVLFRGAVLVAVRGVRPDARRPPASANDTVEAARGPLSPELVAALEEAPARPWRTLLDLVRTDGVLGPALLLFALALATAGVIVEALLFRGLFDVGSHLALSGQRVGALSALAALVGALLLLEFPIVSSALRLGRRLEARLRVAFLRKIPRLGDRYFQSRPASDMAERSHSIHQIRLLPDLATQLARALFELVLTAAAIAWLDPRSAPIAALSAAAALSVPFLVQPVLQERDLRVRTHTGALGRFYLDAFLGLVTVRTHGAEAAVRREHEGLLVEWARAGFALQRAVVTVEGAQLLVGFGLAAWLLLNRLNRGGEPGAALLLAYWALNLPILGQELAHAAWQYPAHRNVMLRLIEPLGALEDAVPSPDAESGISRTGSITGSAAAMAEPRPGVAIVFDDVSVRAAGHTILHDLRLSIPGGSHIAIVGASGAGKSSFVGLLLGWHRPAAGRVLVDDDSLDGPRLDLMRGETAWVDPAVQLWNQSLLDNLQYGSDRGATELLSRAIDAADLREVLEQLPDGLQTTLGEGGGSISGGEGQRVRLARALFRPGARLVILDEPFRGLERERRRDLLERSRRLWHGATLLCITHDVGETLAFDRVLVVSEGRIVEDDEPAALAGRPGSRYRAMLAAETMVREGLWQNVGWRSLILQHGRLRENRDEVAT